jgi:uncharacterized protein (DUF433 family)
MAFVDSYIHWTGCELVEQIPVKVSGRPVVRGTRILADTIVQDTELGSSLEEIHENYPDLPVTAIRQLISLLIRTVCSPHLEGTLRPQCPAQVANEPRFAKQARNHHRFLPGMGRTDQR